MGKCFENNKPTVEGLFKAEKSKRSAVWLVLPFGSSPCNELSTEHEVCFGKGMVFLITKLWSELTFMLWRKLELKPGDKAQAEILGIQI